MMKKEYAESLLQPFAQVTYVATGYQADGADGDWAQRVRRHAQRRPAGWQTIETIDLPPVLAEHPSPVLIDCFSLWLTRVMDKHGCWQAERTPPELAGELDRVVEAWRARRAPAVAVSNEVGMGVVPGTWAGRSFRDNLGWLNRELAAVSDSVWLLVAGLPVRVK